MGLNAPEFEFFDFPLGRLPIRKPAAFLRLGAAGRKSALRRADAAWIVLTRVLSWALNRRNITGKLARTADYSGARAE
jgi:hypothetical protein